MLGFETELTQLNGEPLKVSRKKVTWSGFKQRITNRGMPIRDLEFGTTKRGSLVVTFDIAFPEIELSESQKLQISEILNQDLPPSVANGFL